MSDDYEMMCGIEIHQQLDTKKLFCSCDSILHEEGTGAIYRRQRPTTSEMGEIDRAALRQFADRQVLINHLKRHAFPPSLRFSRR